MRSPARAPGSDEAEPRWVVRQAGDPALALQLLEVREHGQPRDRMERRGDLPVDSRDDVGRGFGARAEGGEDLRLALQPVGDVTLDDRAGRLEDRSVSRVDALDVHSHHPAEGGEVVGEVTIVGWDHGRRAAEDEVAGEEGPL